MQEVQQKTAQGDDGAISVSFAVPGGMPWARLVSLHITLGGASDAENLVISKDSGLGAAFDVVLHTQDMDGLSSYTFFGGDELFLRAESDFAPYAGDAIVVTHTNTADDSWAIEAIFQQV